MKKIILTFLLTPSFMLPLTPKEERIIRKELYAAQEQGQLSKNQLFEPGMRLSDVIVRDLDILLRHKTKLQSKIDFHKSGFIRTFVPAVNGLVASLCAIVSGVSSTFTLFSSIAVDNIWNGKNDTRVWLADGCVNFLSQWGAVTPKELVEYNKFKLDHLAHQYPGFVDMSQALPAAAVVSVISSALLIQTLYTIYKYKGRVDAYIKKTQVRWNRDQAVIMKLKEMQQELAVHE